MSVRLDKWLQITRVFKTRTQASKACGAGRVRVDGRVAKPHHRLAVGDQVEIQLRRGTRVVMVRELRDRPLPKSEAARLYKELTPPRKELEPAGRWPRQAPAWRDRGEGRPTKKQRRQIERFRSR